MFVDNSFMDAVLRGTVLSAVGLTWIVFLVRIVGLSSFSKMTNFDFVMTIAMGSLLATSSQSETWLAFAQSLAAIATLFAVQVILAKARLRWPRVRRTLQNRPVLLMRDGHFLEHEMRAQRVSRGDLLEKLRGANVSDLSTVKAVVLETTGDVSVLHGDPVSEALVSNVA
ncbi:DUF421 domain-containing protein [Silicimonas algicola]|uniref:Uncharacterized protein DUF421 n=1 Tax=Silicimonas algicola TaxID=1826607 RepID=A0A316GGD7_9RHOB|nr:YetF domain-containing protein [Silicimonas algicola]AZQ66153.1 DUF421 domain-containing protein [Silicimonas algicola]PWK58460.1 uncharacterized protein DUF421 [Silicimonas algicola]